MDTGSNNTAIGWTGHADTAATPPLPEGADGWHLPNGRIVYPAGDAFVAADEGGWIDGPARPTVAAWLEGEE